jgi:hypothetical protein
MAIQLRDVLQSIRMFPLFGEQVVTHRALIDGLGRLQRSLTHQATQRRRDYLSQTFTIGFDLRSLNQPGTAGVGTAGGLPIAVSNAGVASVEEATVGLAQQYDLANAVVLYPETPVTSAISTVLLRTAAAFPAFDPDTDAVRIKHGPGAGQVRRIVSNDADEITHEAWDTLPTDKSTFDVIQLPTTGTDDMGVVTGLPAYRARTGYLVRLNAAGVAYVDFTAPILTRVEDGIPLPPHSQILGGTVLFAHSTVATDAENAALAQTPNRAPFAITSYGSRFRQGFGYTGYLLGQSLFLGGLSSDWATAQSVELRYVPIPPLFQPSASVLTEYFLLPDTAYEPLVAGGQLIAAQIAAAKGVEVDVRQFKVDAQEVTAIWLSGVNATMNAVRKQIPRAR